MLSSHNIKILWYQEYKLQLLVSYAAKNYIIAASGKPRRIGCDSSTSQIILEQLLLVPAILLPAVLLLMVMLVPPLMMLCSLTRKQEIKEMCRTVKEEWLNRECDELERTAYHRHKESTCTCETAEWKVTNAASWVYSVQRQKNLNGEGDQGEVDRVYS
jgi:hypothetical protein